MAPSTLYESVINRVHQHAAQLESPKELYSGMRLRDSFVPDNIVFFLRTDTSAFLPEGVSNNFHHRFELVVVLRKGGAVRVGNHSHVLEPGESILIFPNQFHHYMDIEEGELEWLFITFELWNETGIKKLRDLPRVLDTQSLNRIEQILKLRTAKKKFSPDKNLEISFQLSEILRGMLDLPMIPVERRNIHSTDDTRDVILEKINAVVRENLNRQITIADLAEEMDYSVSYLRAIFRDSLGVSLGRYIRESRLSRAAELLQKAELSVTEIAAQTGFESLFAFSRAFKKAYGVSPKAYSKLVRQD